MIEQLWSDLIEFTSQFVVPDWGALIALLPVFLALPVFLYITWTIYKLATAGPDAQRQAAPAAGRAARASTCPGRSFAPFVAAVGVFMLAFGLVAGGIWLLVGAVALGDHAALLGPRGAARLRRASRPVAGQPRHASGMLPAPAGTPPEGVHIPPPSFRPLLVAIAMTHPRGRADRRRLADPRRVRPRS